MRIKRRRLLIITLSACQLGCLVFGVVWAVGWLKDAFDHVLRLHTDSVGRSVALEIVGRFEDLSVRSIDPGTRGWESVQRICEELEAPNDGYISVVRADNGALLCHPDLKDDPTLLGRFPGRSFLQTPKATISLIDAVSSASLDAHGFVTGKMEHDGRLYIVSSYLLPKLNAILLVHQSEAHIDHAIEQLVQPVMQAGFVMTAFLVGVTSMFTVFLLNRYEDKLANANEELEDEVGLRTQSLLRTRNAVIFGLAKLADSRDTFTGEHLDRIRSYVTILSSEMAKTNPDITHQYVADLAVASSLHDIGKVGVPDAILLKPGKLTPAERQAMELHTKLGSECLEAIQRQLGDDDFLQLAQLIALCHHEHWDGSGYPNGLQGQSIPLAARIVALADVYDALTTVRPYKGAADPREARDWIAGRYGTQFDPDVVEAFLNRIMDFERISQEYLDSQAKKVEFECDPSGVTCDNTTEDTVAVSTATVSLAAQAN